MTNGEKIQETFPNMRITVCESYVQVIGEKYEFNNTYPLDWWNAEYKEPTTKNDLGVDPIDRVELLRAMITWDKFGYSTRYGLERLDKDDKGFVPYVKYDDMLKCVKGMSSVTPQEPKIKLISVADAAQKLCITSPYTASAFMEDIKYMESAGLRFCEVEE